MYSLASRCQPTPTASKAGRTAGDEDQDGLLLLVPTGMPSPLAHVAQLSAS